MRKYSWILLLRSPLAMAAEENLLDFSLEQLLQIEVTTASKTPMSLTESPGIVTVYTAEEIALFGGRDLGEVLSRVTGFQEYATLENGRNKISIRSDQVTSNNNHVLILLNGTPLNRESYAGGIWNEAILQSIPLGIIAHIEVTRGPGSVLYGTNAFAGVVNIVTRKDDKLGNRVTLSYGRFDTRAANLNVALTLQDWQWNTSVRLFETDGWPFEMNDVNGERFQNDASSESPGFISTLSKGKFYASAYWGKADQFTIRGPSDDLTAGFTNNTKYMLEAAYTAEFAGSWQLKNSISHVGGDTDHAVAVPGGLRVLHYESRDYRLESTASGSMANGLSWLMGGTVDLFTGEADILEDWSQYLLGVYGQLDYQRGNTRYLVGAQYNEAEDSHSRWVPRLGVIHQFSDQWGLKLLYGQAFRASSSLERKIDVVIPALKIRGDPDLDPEIVTNWDVQLFYTGSTTAVSLSLFRTEQTDLIVRDVVAPGEVEFANKGELVIKGAELEYKATYGNHWYVSGNYNYQQNQDDSSVNNYTLLPRHSVKLGVGYTAASWSLGLFDVWNDAYYDNTLHLPAAQATNPPSDSHHRLSLNIDFAPAQLQGWSIGAYIDNLLDEDVYLPIQPGGLHFDINTTPVMAGRYYQLSISKVF